MAWGIKTEINLINSVDNGGQRGCAEPLKVQALTLANRSQTPFDFIGLFLMLANPFWGCGMSHEATAWAFSQRGLSPAQFRILVILADCHNPSHGCFPSQDFIADASEMSLRTVQTHLAALEEMGLISRERRVGAMGQCAGTFYTFDYEKGQPAKSACRDESGVETPYQPANLRSPNMQLIAGSNEPVKEPLPPKSPYEEIGYSQPKPRPPGFGTKPKSPHPSWTGDPVLRNRVVASEGDGWAKSYLDPCRQLADGSLVAATLIGRDKLLASPALRGIQVYEPSHTIHELREAG